MSPPAPALQATIAGIGFWTRGLPDWSSARAFAQGTPAPAEAPARPSPQLLPPNERRRAPETVAVALEVALAACQAAGRDPATLPSVFASSHGDLTITDYMASTLAQDPRALSPTRFHNSVHNAAAGYWTIGTGATTPATALSGYRASFALGLLEALVQLHAGAEAVLLAGYDGGGSGPLGEMALSQGLLGAALVLTRAGDGPRLQAHWQNGASDAPPGPLASFTAGNIMASMLPLFDALALHHRHAALHAGPGRVLALELTYG